MSDRPQRDLASALCVAEAVLAELAPGCERIALAGSARRRKPQVSDLELVAIPRPQTDLYGTPTGSLLDPILEGLVAAGRMQSIKGGSRYKQFLLVRSGMVLDLFLVTSERCPLCGEEIGAIDEKDKNRTTMPAMQKNIPCVDGRILQQAVLNADAVGDNSGTGQKCPGAEPAVSDVQKEVHHHLILPEKKLLPEVRSIGQGGSPQREESGKLEGRVDSRRVPDDLLSEMGKPQGRIRSGASRSDAGESGAQADPKRDCASSQRNQTRQQIIQSGNRASESTQGIGDLPALPETIQRPVEHCRLCRGRGWYAPTWGVQMVIRTGPAAFSCQVVLEVGRRTFDGRPGLLPRGYRVSEGRIWDAQGEPVETPDEESVFRVLGLDFIPPEERT